MRTWLVVVAVVLATGACTPLCSRAPAASGPTQNLVLSGPVAGTVTSGSTSCTHYPSQKQANFHVAAKLGGVRLEFNLQVNGYGGPGTYAVGAPLDGAGEVRLQVGDFNADSGPGAGTATINSDGKSGSLDVNLSGGERVKGTFACDKLTTG